MITLDVKIVERNLRAMLRLVQRGVTIRFAKHGQHIASIKPILRVKLVVKDVIRQMEGFQKAGPTLGPDLTIRQLIDEGRR